MEKKILKKIEKRSAAFAETSAFQLAKSKVPNYEVDDFKKLMIVADMISDVKEKTKLPSDDVIRELRVQTRHQNPICCNPGCKDPEAIKLKLYGGKGGHQWCGCCRLMSYCSRECQLQDYPRHKVWSRMLPHSPRPTIPDPQAPTLAKLDSRGNVIGTLCVEATGDVLFSTTEAGSLKAGTHALMSPRSEFVKLEKDGTPTGMLKTL